MTACSSTSTSWAFAYSARACTGSGSPSASSSSCSKRPIGSPPPCVSQPVWWLPSRSKSVKNVFGCA